MENELKNPPGRFLSRGADYAPCDVTFWPFATQTSQTLRLKGLEEYNFLVHIDKYV